ncbi:hypothetical protein [Streptococcus pantholopis]|uniref:Uncharacterized protein n=1 Tax=Streptococcus pantholopis TaxID=1811193 RepID=A0A172Q7T8_9STRE|nr:hypothetical protein [Streptococcus pantholopis]AND79534.1 hypothetical protein A0O21_05565 [Streptococcus pantholopis]
MEKRLHSEEESVFIYDQNRLCLYLLNHYEMVDKVEVTAFYEKSRVWISKVLVNREYEADALIWPNNGSIILSEPFSQNKGGCLVKKAIPSQINSLSDLHIDYQKKPVAVSE